MKVYRKKTHTDQYLSFESYHPLPHKLRVIRTLYERANNIITEPEDQRQEIIHINNALRVCGYPDWFFKEVREWTVERQNSKGEEKETEEWKTRLW